jgi:beta-glucoside operon transcriptional antiterminator
LLAVRRINNNVVLCRDGNNRELIALGKGIGFGELPRELSLNQIERTFYDVDDRYQPLLVDLPPAVLSFAACIVDIARNELSYELSPNTVFTLADHINFAMERARKQLRVRMPLAYDVEQTYPREYRIGQYTVKRILKEFHIALPREEAAGIALNLLNAKLVPEDPAEQEQARDCAEMLEEITELVEQEFKIIIDRESFNYSRYATHLQYLFDRIRDHKEISSDNLQLYKSLREEFPDVAACVEKIADHIRQSWGSELSEEEKLYLILHVNRICIKEGL